jgi:hypothetical protein
MGNIAKAREIDPQRTNQYLDKLPYLLGEIAITAARFVTCCHKKRVISEEQTPLYIQPTFIYFP